MNNAKNIFRFCVYIVAYPVFLITRKLYRFYSDKEIIALITEKKYSLSRFGDGEFKWMLGLKQESFQTDNETMKKELVDTIKGEYPSLIIAIPGLFCNMSKYNLESRYYWSKFFIINRKSIKGLLNTERQYGDSMISRPYICYRRKEKMMAEKRFLMIRKIWDGKRIMIVEGEKTRMGIGNNLFDNAKSIRRIICPNINAFDKYEEILDAIKELCHNELVLVALGPTATIICRDLCMSGIQAIDLGHLDIEYEWFKKGAKKKTPINGKFVNEARNKDTEEYETDNLLYEAQIIKKVV